MGVRDDATPSSAGVGELRPVVRKRWLGRWCALVTALVVLATGCAGMPDSGNPKKVEREQKADQDSQVRVFGVKPKKGMNPRQLVDGFLEATTGDEANYATAKDYLTKRKRHTWRPQRGIAVLARAPDLTPGPRRPADAKDNGVGKKSVTSTVTLSGSKIAEVDRRNGYHAVKHGHTSYSEDFHLRKNGEGQWRIDKLPDGLILTQNDFQRIFRSVDLYYYASFGVGRELRPGKGRQAMLVPDAVYVRRRADATRTMLRALVSGPSRWMEPVARSAFPKGAKIRNPTTDDEGWLRVRITGAQLRNHQRKCRNMAAQIMRTVNGQAAGSPKGVRLREKDGKGCSMAKDTAQRYDPVRFRGSHTSGYFVDQQGRVRVLRPKGLEGTKVDGPLGEGQVESRSVGVRRDEKAAAVVTEDGKSLYTSRLRNGGASESLGTPLLESETSGVGRGLGLTAPTWDAYDELWVADTGRKKSKVRLFEHGKDRIDVVVPDLGHRRITAMRVAADGTRLAMVVREKDKTEALVGRVERAGTARNPEVTVVGLRHIAPDLERISAISWAAPSQLVVLGKEEEGVQQLQFVDTDGSHTFTPLLPSVPKMRSVAASQEQDVPLVADSSDEDIFRLRHQNSWKQISPKGKAPVYPG